MKTTGALQGS